MSVVAPQASRPARITGTMTQRLMQVRPSRLDLVDAAFVSVLCTLALTGFDTTFDTRHYLLVSVVGVLLGVLLAHLVQSLRWPWLSTVVLTLVAFVLVGGIVALRTQLIAGALPTPAVVRALVNLAVHGWKVILTSLPPMDGPGEYVVIPYLMGLFASAAAYEIARRNRHALPVLIVPFLLFVAVLLLGTQDPVAATLRGLLLAAVGFGWLVVRWQRRTAVRTAGRAGLAPRVTGLTLCAVAVAVSAVVAPLLPGVASTRLILRTYVQPPFDVTSYPSPIGGFRLYPKDAGTYWNSSLLQVDGSAPGALLRMAVLDAYDGTVWSASPTSGEPGKYGSFHQVGEMIDRAAAGGATLTLTVQPDFARISGLGPWLPGLGQASRVTFVRGAVTEHRRGLYYNAATGQAVLPDRLRTQDVVRIQTSVIPTVSDEPQPYGSVDLDPESYGFVAPQTTKWSGEHTSSWSQLTAVMHQLKSGYYSDGNRKGEAQYTPGHSIGRLLGFLGGQQLVGSDEQYAATLALMANQLGYPARVVFGASVPNGGLVRGEDVHVWVEVRTADGSWQAIPYQTFTPDRDRHPDLLKEPKPKPKPNANVPPPNAIKPPGSIDELLDNDPSATRTKAPEPRWWERIPAVVWLVAEAVGIPAGAALLFAGVVAFLRTGRRRRRRMRGRPQTQVAMGWFEVLDRARDLGQPWSASATRREQSARLGVAGLGDLDSLAAEADEAVFGPGTPDPDQTGVFWDRVAAGQRSMSRAAGRRRRLLATFSLASLLHPASRTNRSGRVNRPVFSLPSRPLPRLFGTRRKGALP